VESDTEDDHAKAGDYIKIKDDFGINHHYLVVRDPLTTPHNLRLLNIETGELTRHAFNEATTTDVANNVCDSPVMVAQTYENEYTLKISLDRSAEE
jgi:hypothetical protein